MKRYIRAILGGVLAVLAGIGWVFAIGERLASRGIDVVIAVHTPKRFVPLVLLILVFSAGFFLAFRAAYFRDPN